MSVDVDGAAAPSPDAAPPLAAGLASSDAVRNITLDVTSVMFLGPGRLAPI